MNRKKKKKKKRKKNLLPFSSKLEKSPQKLKSKILKKEIKKLSFFWINLRRGKN